MFDHIDPAGCLLGALVCALVDKGKMDYDEVLNGLWGSGLFEKAHIKAAHARYEGADWSDWEPASPEFKD